MASIFFHRDFDGAAAAGLLANFFDSASSEAREGLELHAVDYDDLHDFLRRPLPPASAVVDFAFHPQATWWFDHHASPFHSAAHAARYRPGSRMMWDRSARSCPELLGQVFSVHEEEYWREARSEYAELVRWSNVIDSAMYDNPAAAYDFANPYLVVREAIHPETGSNDTILDFIAAVRGRQLERFFTSQAILAARERLESVLREQRAQCERSSTVHDNVLVTDVTDTDQEPWRYVGYLDHPDVPYTMTLARRRASWYLGVGANPWLGGNPINLGELMSSYGGGGRHDVGAALLADEAELRRVAAGVLGRLSQLPNRSVTG